MGHVGVDLTELGSNLFISRTFHTSLIFLRRASGLCMFPEWVYSLDSTRRSAKKLLTLNRFGSCGHMAGASFESSSFTPLMYESSSSISMFLISSSFDSSPLMRASASAEVGRQEQR